MSKEIELTQGKVAIVDDDMFDYLSQWKWHAHHNYRKDTYYAETMIKGKVFSMHRIIMESSGREQVDHINLNTLDNRKENLRKCSNMENSWNTSKHSNNTSGYKGVTFYKNKKKMKYRAAIHKNGKDFHIGCYSTAEEAAIAYDQKARELFGDFAKTNFSDEMELHRYQMRNEDGFI